MQNYFTKILEDDLKALIKPQYVDQIPKAVRGTVRQLLEKKNEKDNVDEICRMLGMFQINIIYSFVAETTKFIYSIFAFTFF